MKKLLMIGVMASLAACELPPPATENAAPAADMPMTDMPMTDMPAQDAGAEQATPTDIVPAN